VQLDLVRCGARLPVREVMHAHACNPHWYVNGLKAGGDIEHGIHLGPGAGDAGIHRTTGRYAARCGNLSDHGKSRGVLDDQMIVLVAFQLNQGQGRVHDPDCGFLWRNAVIGRDRARCGKGPQVRYRGGLWRIKVDLADIGVGSYFDRLAFHTARKS
jgi:hypothetical protein